MKKKAQFAASKLDGPAFDVFTRLSDEDKNDYDKLKGELLKEFEKGQLNREEAIQELDERKRLPGESPLTYAHKVKELVKLAYPSFPDATRLSIAKDYFVRGLYTDMQLALKTTATFSTNSIDQLADEVSRLELAGVKSHQVPRAVINSCNEITDDAINSIAEKVFEKFKNLNAFGPSESRDEGYSRSLTVEKRNFAVTIDLINNIRIVATIGVAGALLTTTMEIKPGNADHVLVPST